MAATAIAGAVTVVVARNPIYSAMGHWGDAYRTVYYPKLLEGAIAWAGGIEGEGCR